MPRLSETWLQVSAHRFALRRVECALLGEDVQAANPRGRVQTASLTLGCVLAAVVVAGSAAFAWLRPHVALDRAQIVVSRESGALFVRVGDVWHPVLNLASARLIAGVATNPQPVHDSDLSSTKRGPLLGIPGAPQFLGTPLSPDQVVFSLCDSDGASTTTAVIGSRAEDQAHRLTSGQAALVTPVSGSPAYLLYDGRRAVVDLADTAVLRALRLEGRTPLRVSQSLLNAVSEAPPIAVPRIRGLGGMASGVPGFAVGSVLRVTRADGDEYYAVLDVGVQRIGRVAADLLRFSAPHGAADTVAVAPEVIGAAPVVAALPVAGFPDRPPTLSQGARTFCVSWQAAQSGRADVTFLAGDEAPAPPGHAPVTLAQADGRGPALDAVSVPAGRSAYVQASGETGTRYLITDTGVRFAIHDEDAARDLGLTAASPAPWPLLAVLPAGPELSRQSASIARDVVASSP